MSQNVEENLKKYCLKNMKNLRLNDSNIIEIGNWLQVGTQKRWMSNEVECLYDNDERILGVISFFLEKDPDLSRRIIEALSCHFSIGNKVKIIDGFYKNEVLTIEERRMSSGIISIPEYYMKGYWYYENELQLEVVC